MKPQNSVWSMVRLHQVIVDMQPGFAQRPNLENIGVPQLRTNNISPQGTIDFTDLINVTVSPAELEKYAVRKGDIIFNNTNSMEWVGKTTCFNYEGDYVLSNHMTRIRVNTTVLDSDFLARYLHYLWQVGWSASRAKQWVNQAAIDQTMLAQFEVPLPPLPEQRRIVSILRQADRLRQLRRESEEKAQQLLPALFVVMFGDPSVNPMGWKKFRLELLLSTKRKSITTGPFGSALKREEYVETGIPVWGIDNVQPNEFVETGSYFITPSKYATLVEYLVKEGDILISRAGTVGRVCVAYPSQRESIVGTNLIRLSLDEDRIHPEYFTALCTFFPDRLGNLRASGDESAYSFLNPSSLKSLQIPLPSIGLQNEFVRESKQVRKINVHHRASYQYLNALFQSLLTQAFSCELTATWREGHEGLESSSTPDISSTDALEIQDELRAVSQVYIEESAYPSESIEAKAIPARQIYTNLSEEQQKICDMVNNTKGYCTVETLKASDKGKDLSLHAIRQGLQLLVQIGLIQAVCLPDRPIRNIVYVPTYRALDDSDLARTPDIGLLQQELQKGMML